MQLQFSAPAATKDTIENPIWMEDRTTLLNPQQSLSLVVWDGSLKLYHPALGSCHKPFAGPLQPASLTPEMTTSTSLRYLLVSFCLGCLVYVKVHPHFEKKIMVHAILKVLPIKGIYVEWKFLKYLSKRALSISLKLSVSFSNQHTVVLYYFFFTRYQ